MISEIHNDENDQYSRHLSAISGICESSRLSLVRMYWQIGMYISKLSDNRKENGYGSAFITRLSGDLSSRYGRGFSVTNIKNMRLFFRTYEFESIEDPLEWSHYVLLLSVKDPSARREIENRIISESLSHHDIRKTIKNKQIAGLLASGIEYSPVPLSFTRGQLYVYSLAHNSAVPSSSGTVAIDCGFNIHRDIRVPDPERFSDGMYVKSIKNRRSFSLKSLGSSSASGLYTYRASVERVIDGDTVLASIDCGFYTRVRKKLRLRGIDCAEADTASGQSALKFVNRTLKDSPVVALKVYKPDKYERYITDLFYLPGESDPERICREGILLNQVLLDSGHAIKY